MSIPDLFEQHKNKNITVLLNVGNKGDGIIHMGGIELFKKHNITYREIYYPQKTRGEILFVHGAGGFCLPFHHNVKRTQFYYGLFDKIYILPASFDISCLAVKKFIANLPERVTVYCREKYSFNQVIRTASFRENIFLGKDLAFFANYKRWEKQGVGILVSLRKDWQNDKKFTRKYARKIIHSIINLRLKHRKPTIKIDFFDASYGRETESERLLEDLSNYDEVYTDRAHIAIAAAMLRKKTHIYPGFYHKVKGIYEYSLADFPNVKWMR